MAKEYPLKVTKLKGRCCAQPGCEKVEEFSTVATLFDSGDMKEIIIEGYYSGKFVGVYKKDISDDFGKELKKIGNSILRKMLKDSINPIRFNIGTDRVCPGHQALKSLKK